MINETNYTNINKDQLYSLMQKYCANGCTLTNWGEFNKSNGQSKAYWDLLYSSCLEDMRDDIGICGCGMPEIICEDVYKMLKHFNNQRNAYNQTECKDFEDNMGENYYLFMAYMLNDKGLLEHGTSIYSSWVTEKGYMYMFLFENVDISEE